MIQHHFIAALILVVNLAAVFIETSLNYYNMKGRVKLFPARCEKPAYDAVINAMK